MASVEYISIEAPKLDEENENIYKFNILTSNGDNLTYKSEHLYTIRVENEQMLTIPSKGDLRSLSDIYNNLKSSFLEGHDKWFEEKFTAPMLDDLFKNFLYPNIVENRIDLKVSLTSDVMNELKEASKGESSVIVFPTFSFDAIVLNVDNNKMNCTVTLKEFSTKEPELEDQVVEDQVVEDQVVEDQVVENQVLEELALEKNEEQHIESEDISSDLKEMDFDTSNLADSEIKVNVEDYMIIYKYILGKIKDNKIREIEKICASKNIDMEILDCQDIFDESEDEYFSSDAESENSDESSFN